MEPFLLFFFIMSLWIEATAVHCSSSLNEESEGTCEAEFCFRNKTQHGCMAPAGCRRSSVRASCADSEEWCCCQNDWCNRPEAKRSSSSSSLSKYMPHILVLVLACVAFLAFLIIIIFKGRMRFLQQDSDPPDPTSQREKRRSKSKKSKRKHKRRSSTKSTTYSEDTGVSTEPAWDKESGVVDHVDMTHVKVEAAIPSNVKRDIADCLQNGAPALEQQATFDNSPKITRIVTYSASEHITLLESPPPTPPTTVQTLGKQCAADLLIQLIENGPREFEFDRKQLQEVLRMGANLFLEEPTLLEIPVPCMVYGDTHGQYSDLLRWFNLNGWPHETRCVFLGDFVDRGSHGVELFALLTTLKVCFPDNIFIIRGNHEEETLNQIYSFASEVHYKFDAKSIDPKIARDPMYDHFKNVFMNLPLACLIGGEILAMHGGISPKLRSLQDIREISRPIQEFEKGTLACDLVWSDPDTLNIVSKFQPNFEREAQWGIGQLFSQSAVKEACKRLNVKLIIRGHQAPLHGYACWAKGLLITLFSAPAYKGSTEETVNLGACIEAPASGELIVKQLKVTEKVRRKRAEDQQRRFRSRYRDYTRNILDMSSYSKNIPMDH